MTDHVTRGGQKAPLSWMSLPLEARAVAEALYQRQPATPEELAARVGVPADEVSHALTHLRETGVLRGGVPLSDGRAGYVWLDLMPAARRAHGVEVA